MKLIYQMIRKSGLPIYYTKGFNRRPKLSFCSPLALGMTGHNEFFDLRLLKKEKKNKIITALSKNNHNGFKITEIIGPPKILPKVGSFKNELIRISSSNDKNFKNQISSYDKNDCFYGKKDKKVFMDDVINNIDYKDDAVVVNKKIIGAGIIDILNNFYNLDLKEISSLNIERLNLI